MWAVRTLITVGSLNSIEWFETLGTLPIVLQLGLVHQTPLPDDGGYFAR